MESGAPATGACGHLNLLQNHASNSRATTQARKNVAANVPRLLPNAAFFRMQRSPEPCRDAGLVRQRIRTHLHLEDFWHDALAAFAMEIGACAGGRPKPAALPACIGIVNPAIDVLAEESQGVGDPKVDEVAVDERKQRLTAI